MKTITYGRTTKLFLLFVLLLGAASIRPGLRLYAQSVQPVMDQATLPGVVTEGLQVSATVLSTHPAPKVMDVIVLDLAVKNVTDKVVGLPETGTAINEFHLQVKDAKGVQVPLTAYGRRVVSTSKLQMYRLNRMEALGPGQVKHFYIWLNRSYDLSISGGYSVVARYDAARLDGKGSATLVSNVAKFDISPTTEAEVINSLIKQ